jgi:hypothetical protein
MNQPAILYCHCQYAKVIPEEVKKGVLRKLCESGQPFEAVADLCEMSARKDPTLQRLAACHPVKIAACYPRAVKWLFAAANAQLSQEDTEVVNLRTLTADEACAAIFNAMVTPNLPTKESQLTRQAEPLSAPNIESIPA